MTIAIILQIMRLRIGKPQVQMDFMFLGQNCPSLLMIDSWTRMGKIIPAASKSATRNLAEEIVKFPMELQYLEHDVEFVMDGGPSTIALLDMVISIRQRMGFKATKLLGKPHCKGRTAKVERYVQTVRNQATALVCHIEDAINGPLAGTHGLRAYALSHAVWPLNRFHCHRALQSTPIKTGQICIPVYVPHFPLLMYSPICHFPLHLLSHENIWRLDAQAPFRSKEAFSYR